MGVLGTVMAGVPTDAALGIVRAATALACSILEASSRSCELREGSDLTTAATTGELLPERCGGDADRSSLVSTADARASVGTERPRSAEAASLLLTPRGAVEALAGDLPLNDTAALGAGEADPELE